MIISRFSGLIKTAMSLTLYTQIFKDAIQHSDVKGFQAALNEALEKLSEEDVNSVITDIMVQNYTRKRSDAFAMFLQVVLRTRLSLGSLEKHNNVYFRMCLFTGSFDMYECFIEEFVEPYYEQNVDDKMEYIIDLYTVAEQTIEVW